MRKKNRIAGSFIAAAVLVGTTGIAGTAGAQTTTAPQVTDTSVSPKRHSPMGLRSKIRMRGVHKGHRDGHRGVLGTVTSIEGTKLTVTSHDGTVHAVEASGAKVLKSVDGSTPTEVSLRELSQGETVGVRGVVSGTGVTATEIFAGVPPRPVMPFMHQLRK